MRNLKTKIGGKQFTLAATWGASVEIAEDVGDPLMIAREAGLESLMLAQGIAYQPKWRMTVQNVPHILWIGAKAGGSDVTIEQMQGHVFDEGFLAAQETVGDYLALIVRKPGGDDETKATKPAKK